MNSGPIVRCLTTWEMRLIAGGIRLKLPLKLGLRGDSSRHVADLNQGDIRGRDGGFSRVSDAPYPATGLSGNGANSARRKLE